MNFPSFQLILNKALETFKRFPLTLLSAFITTALMIIVVDSATTEETAKIAGKLAMTFYLAMLLFLALSFFSERVNISNFFRLILILFIIIILGFFYFSITDVYHEKTIIRFIVFSICGHLLVAFIPYAKRDEINGFWQFNKSIFIRILTAALYSTVLYGGLSLAMLAVENLFDVYLEPDNYGKLFFLIAGVFNTWFFLAGVPPDLSSLENETDYPKGLNIFTQYVLLPLVLIYLIILYLYGARIIITSNWPQGWVAYLIIAFSIFGILSFLLIYPLRNQSGNNWIRLFSKWFYILIIPLIILLFIAIYKRVDEFGFTEKRYYLYVLAIWLLIVAVYFSISKKENIKFIPITLFCFGLFASFGPWGAFNVSLRSQLKEFDFLMHKHNVLKNNMVDTTFSHTIPDDDFSRVHSIVIYITEMHGIENFQPYFSFPIDSVVDKETRERSSNSYVLRNNLIASMKINPESDEWRYISPRVYINAALPINVENHDAAFFFYLAGHDKETIYDFIIEGDTLHATYDWDINEIKFYHKTWGEVKIELAEWLRKLYDMKNKNGLDPGKLSITGENEFYYVKIIFNSLYIYEETKLYTSEGEGIVLIKVK